MSRHSGQKIEINKQTKKKSKVILTDEGSRVEGNKRKRYVILVYKTLCGIQKLDVHKNFVNAHLYIAHTICYTLNASKITLNNIWVILNDNYNTFYNETWVLQIWFWQKFISWQEFSNKNHFAIFRQKKQKNFIIHGVSQSYFFIIKSLNY